ncbi:MAG: NAD+ synthase [Gammaproteobacteria bacterium]
MAQTLRVVLAQINLMVGDIAGNLTKHLEAAYEAGDKLSADVIVFPELSLTGYPSEDLLLRPSFIQEVNEALQQFIMEIRNIHCVVGHPYATEQGIFNACSLIHNGNIIGQYAKQHLPNYGVFDEARYFTPGDAPCVVPINGIPTGLVICEDLWFPEPVQRAKAEGARIILSPNASPFEVDKHKQRYATLAARAEENKLPIIYVNQVGGQDDLIFDGDSMVIDEEGEIRQQAAFCEEELLTVDIIVDDSYIQMESAEQNFPSTEEKTYQALCLSLRDYVAKNNFSSVVLGLSGGIDSALTLALAVDALGNDRVHAVMMPSRFTTEISVEDAIMMAEELGVTTETISIESVYQSFLDTLAPSFGKKKTGLTEENLQARCRGMILMALSNKYGHLVLSTGNRSELAVGYCTLYGDMAGGFAPLKDVPKTLAYDLANYRNTISPIIPQRTIDRAPSAELAPNQKDEDSLPPYPVLDHILYAYLNLNQGIADIVAQGFDKEVVTEIVDLVRKNEYKRRQSAVGPRINSTAFGRDRRYPITNGFKG